MPTRFPHAAGPPVFSLGLAALVGCALVTPSLAAMVNIDYVSVGNAGNATDASTGYGSVGYAYNIGKYEVTNSQYAAFLNAKGSTNSNGIYHTSMSSYGITQTGVSGSFTYIVTPGMENRPVVLVSWYDAARFTNWLGNGQGSGDMENGAYTLTGNTGMPTVNVGATVWIPSENEWYKAAYYNGGTSSYSLYPNGQNSITIADANYNGGTSTNVGSYSGDPSSYGTFDQGGNVLEWNDAITGSWHGLRGGNWGSSNSQLASSARDFNVPSFENILIGFRVASVPEPSSAVLVIFASGMMLTRRKR